MTPFVAAAIALALIAMAFAVGPLLFARTPDRGRDVRERAVFRDQLAELDRDLARGTISQAEAQGAKAEIARRLIAADQRASRAETLEAAPRAASGVAAVAALIAVPALAALVYFTTGTPGLPDRPFAERPAAERAAAQLAAGARLSQDQAEALRSAQIAQSGAAFQSALDTAEMREYAALIARLEQIVAERPEEIRGRRLLANAYMRLQRFDEARQIYQQLASLLGPRAEATLFAETAEAMVLATGGYVSPEAEQALDRALALDGALPMARYYQGLRLAQSGRPEEALALWAALETEVPEIAQSMPWLADMQDEVRARLDTPRSTAPAAPIPDPDAATVAAMADLPPAERQAMIEGMVARLEARLTDTGGTPEEWFRLINAYDVLDQPDNARRIYALSQEALDGSAASFVREQALLIGVAE
ncbi:MAG: c-type cytochrome biogenesis protein CcmI [Pseudomonadota bacterium]